MLGMSFAVIRFRGRLFERPVNFFDAAVERGGNSVPEMKERIFFEADVTNIAFNPISMFLTLPL